MTHHAGANHIEINVDQATMQMFVGLNSRSVVAIFPERSLPSFALVVFLRSAAGDELHALSNHVFACVVDQQMYMVGRDDVVEDTKSNALLRLEQPVEVTPTIARKLE